MYEKIVNTKMVKKIQEKIYNGLRKSEKLAGTDMVYLAKGASWLTLGHFVSSLGSFLLAVAFANLVPKEIFGTYKFVISIASIILVFSLGGMTNSLNQAVARGFEGGMKRIKNLRIKFGVIGAILSLLISGYYLLLKNNIELGTSFALIAIFIPLLESFNHYESYLQGKKLFREQIVYNIISRLISIGLLITLIFFTNNLYVILLGYFIPWTLTRMFFYFWTLKKFKPNELEDPGSISYGKHLSLVGVVGKIGTYLDNILLFHFLGPVQVATYNFAFAPIEQIRAVYKNIPVLAVPKLANKSLSEIDKVLHSRLIKLLFIGILIAGVYVTCAPFLFKIFFPEYLNAILLSQIFSIILIIRLPLSFISAVTQSQLNITPKNWLYWRQSSHVVQIISMFILIPTIGIMGVVISRILFQITTFIINIVQWKMLLRR